jgi:hypothetical protein
MFSARGVVADAGVPLGGILLDVGVGEEEGSRGVVAEALVDVVGDEIMLWTLEFTWLRGGVRCCMPA